MKHFPAASLAALAALAVFPADARAREAGPELTIDTLYQHQSLIGVAPEGYAWSLDGSQVAFLWNDEGYSFRDVWVYSLADGETSRLTDHGRNSDPEAEHRGISEAVVLAEGRIAYVMDGMLHLLEPDGRSRAVETEKGAVRQLSVSPDGGRLAFVSGGSVDARQDRFIPGGGLWVRPADASDDNEARQLVGHDDPKVYIQSYQWAEAGDRIAFNLADNRLMPERDIYYYAQGELQNNRVARAFPGDETTRYTIGAVQLETGDTQYYERPDARHHIWGYGLSGDGSRVFINSSDMLVKDHTVFVFDAQTAQGEVFHHEHDPKHLRPDWRVQWAPGDDGLIILTDVDGYLHLHHHPEGDAPSRQLTRGEWEISDFTVDRDSGWIYFLANESHLADRQIYRVGVDGGEIERVSGAEPGTHEPVYAPGFTHAASVFTNDDAPPELYLIDLARPGEQTRITRSPRDAFYEKTWADIGYVEFDSHIDGTRLIGRLSLPADYDPDQRYPLIVGSVYSDAVRNQWGGRRAHPTWGLDQYFVSRGYIVLNVNMRGSWGQGRAHNQGLRHDYGGIDIDDIESGVRHLIAEGYVDPDRVGIWGSSYGGLMTLMSLAKKPGVYAAGIAGAPATNVWHAYPSQMWVMGEPDGEDMPDRYQRQSPLYQSDGIKDPVMIIHGTRDPVVLYSDTIAFIERLIGNEQMFELVTLPGGSHSWATDNLAQTRFSFKKMAEFFDLHLNNQN